MKNILEIVRLSLKLSFGATFLIFILISAIFVLSSVMYFVMPGLNKFNSQSPAVNATTMGLSSINIFLIFLTIFLSLAVLNRQFSRESLSFLLSKPIRPAQILVGTQIGLVLAFLAYWFILSLELVIIIFIFDKSFLLKATLALLPIIPLILLYTSLAVFFFCLWPNILCAIFPFLFIITSFVRLDIIELFSQTKLIWLKKLIETSFIFIPPVGQIMAISLDTINLISINIDIGRIAINSIFIILLFGVLALKRSSRIFCHI